MVSVLVACPTYDGKAYCLEAYAAAVKALSYPHDVLLADNSDGPGYGRLLMDHGLPFITSPPLKAPQDRVTEARNALRARFLAGSWTHFFSLEQDVLPPPGIIETLLSHDKPVEGGLYLTLYLINGQPRARPLMWREESPTTMRFMTVECKAPGLHEVRATGLGCLLILREVLEQVKFRTEAGSEAFDDIPFCTDVRGLGFPVFVDSGQACRHLVHFGGRFLDVGLKGGKLDMKPWKPARD